MSYIAEQGVIGSLLMDKDSISQVCKTLEPHMFKSEILGRIYHEFLKGYENGYDVNPIVIEQKIRCDSIPTNMLMDELRECLSVPASSAEIASYSNAIENDYKADRLSNFFSSIKVTPNNLKDSIRTILDELEILQGDKRLKAKTLAEVARENKDKYFTENHVPRINLGFPKLDDLLGGLEGGDVIVIGARPAVGKSAFVTQITSNIAKQGKKIGFYNLEMQNKQVYERFLVSESGISLTRLRRAVRFLGDEKEKFDKANEVLEKADNIVIRTDSKTVSDIRSEVLHMDYDLLIIDYLQLLKADKTYRGNRTAEVGEISKAIKRLAMELNIPIIALSQLNRVSEMRDVKEPTMAELREAGDIEQDASVIILLWNMDPNNRSKKGCKIEKQRQGQTGKVVMNFIGEFMRFEETNDDADSSQWSSSDDDCPFN